MTDPQVLEIADAIHAVGHTIGWSAFWICIFVGGVKFVSDDKS